MKIRGRIEPSCLSQMGQFCKGAKLNKVGYILGTSVTPMGRGLIEIQEKKKGKLSEIFKVFKRYKWRKKEP